MPCSTAHLGCSVLCCWHHTDAPADTGLAMSVRARCSSEPSLLLGGQGSRTLYSCRDDPTGGHQVSGRQTSHRQTGGRPYGAIPTRTLRNPVVSLPSRSCTLSCGRRRTCDENGLPVSASAQLLLRSHAVVEDLVRPDRLVRGLVVPNRNDHPTLEVGADHRASLQPGHGAVPSGPLRISSSMTSVKWATKRYVCHSSGLIQVTSCQSSNCSTSFHASPASS